MLFLLFYNLIFELRYILYVYYKYVNEYVNILYLLWYKYKSWLILLNTDVILFSLCIYKIISRWPIDDKVVITILQIVSYTYG